jgi:hypothetical protein
MKKFITILGVSAAAVLFTTTANAQATISNSKGTATATDLKSTQTNKQVTTSTSTATKATVTAEEKKQAELNSIKEYEQKIEANRNNPKFDIKAAEAELARLRENAGVK